MKIDKYFHLYGRKDDVVFEEIPAPSEQENLQPTCNQLATDCISRQAAIDIVSGYAEQFNGYIGSPNDSEVYAYARDLLLSIERNINAVPSAQPDIARDIATILENEQDMRVILQNAQPTQNNDSNALKALDCIERQTGTWIYTPTEPLGYTCSVCGKGCCRFNFCPNCGARMEGEQE